MSNYATDVRLAISQIGTPPVLVGYAMGGRVAREVADDARLSGLVLVCPVPELGAGLTGLHLLREHPVALARGILCGRSRPDPAMLFEGLSLEQARGYVARQGQESTMAMLGMMRSKRFHSPSCPSAVFAAGADRLHSRSEFEGIASHMSIPITWLPKAGHMPMLDVTAEDSISRVVDWIDSAVA